MMRNKKSGHAALLRPTYSGSLAALALAVAVIAAPASFAQGKPTARSRRNADQPARADSEPRRRLLPLHARA